MNIPIFSSKQSSKRKSPWKCRLTYYSIQTLSHFSNSKIITILLFLALGCFSYLDASSSLRLDRVPNPPTSGGCLVGGKMYTTYLTTLYTGLAGTPPNQTITGYRYQYSSSGAIASCYSGRSNFVGPDPNATGNTPIADIGCGLTSVYANNTISTSTFLVIQCPIDDYILLFFVPFSLLVVRFLAKRTIAISM